MCSLEKVDSFNQILNKNLKLTKNNITSGKLDKILLCPKDPRKHTLLAISENVIATVSTMNPFHSSLAGGKLTVLLFLAK